MFKFSISEPCSYSFDCNDSKPLLIYFSGGLPYHSRKENGIVLVYFAKNGNYKSNYEPIKKGDCSPFLSPSFESESVKIKQGNFLQPVAFINVKEKCIYVCENFKKLNYQYQIAILEHEKAHLQTVDESEADKIGLKNYLKQGFNESQYLHALVNHAPNCYSRINEVKKNLTPIKK
jgi:hypothetical protein